MADYSAVLPKHMTSLIQKQMLYVCLGVCLSAANSMMLLLLRYASHLATCCCAGRKGMLVRKAAKLFVHAKDIIAKTSLASSIGQEYSALLRAHLLPVSQYCNVVSSVPFQGSCTVPCL